MMCITFDIQLIMSYVLSQAAGPTKRGQELGLLCFSTSQPLYVTVMLQLLPLLVFCLFGGSASPIFHGFISVRFSFHAGLG